MKVRLVNVQEIQAEANKVLSTPLMHNEAYRLVLEPETSLEAAEIMSMMTMLRSHPTVAYPAFGMKQGEMFGVLLGSREAIEELSAAGVFIQ